MNSNLESPLNENVRQVNWADLSEEELVLSAYIEGVPPESSTQISSTKTILVSISSEEIETHFGRVKTPPFLELFWRKTGADCVGEEEIYKFPDGSILLVKLCE